MFYACISHEVLNGCIVGVDKKDLNSINDLKFKGCQFESIKWNTK